MVDNETPINFTITPPVSSDPLDPVTHLEHQLILQTPLLAAGLHHLQMSIEPKFGSQTTMVSIERIIVQNSTNSLGLNLSAVPSVDSQLKTGTTGQQTSPPFPSSTGVANKSREPSGMSHGSIVAIVVSTSLFLFLLIIVMVWLVGKAKQRYAARRELISPFVFAPTGLLRLSGGWLSHHLFQEKGPMRQGVHTRTTNTDSVANQAQGRLRRVRYIVHQEGGELAEANREAEESPTLPPLYSVIEV